MASQEGFDPNKLVQIIDKDGEFSDLERMKETLTGWEITSKGFDYFVVAILGCQSSGKSTLLNLLFGTTFPVMEAAEGRTQTTMGVWMGRAKTNSEKEENILVFDVEGTDSRERGEQHASFERKSSLFALALSEVLIVNMWHNDVGRYNAGNISLLKIVFELNLQLFQRSSGPKKTILFVIRDHIPRETGLEKLKGVILKDMKGIWDGLTKSEEFANSKVEDFFIFDFTALPHKILAEEEFYKGVDDLRTRFLDATSPNFILGTENNTHRTDVPADGFAVYSSTVWKTVKENKDLNIPSQKQMLAIFRCDEISAEGFKQFVQTISPLKKTLESGELVSDFGEKATAAYKQLLEVYDFQASRYHKEVAQQKREGLSNSANDALHSLFTLQLQKIADKSSVFFEKVLNESLPSDGSAAPDFARIKESVTSSTLNFFKTRADGCLVEGLDWNYDFQLGELKNSINKSVTLVKNSQLNKLVEEVKGGFNAQFGKNFDRILEKPESDMWPKIRSKYSEAKTKATQTLKERIVGFEPSEEEVETRVAELDEVVFQSMKKRFTDKAKFLDHLLTKKFETLFSLDEQGLPRRWSPSDDISKVFLESRQKADELLEHFTVVRLDEEDDTKAFLDAEKGHYDEVNPKLVILNADEIKLVQDRFYRDVQSMYKQAQRDQENAASSGNVPMYMILLLIFFGFDEFLTVVTNPFLLMLVITFGGASYVLYLLGMLAPARVVVENVLHTTFHQIQEVVGQQMQQYHRNRAQVGNSTSPSSPSSNNEDPNKSKKD